MPIGCSSGGKMKWSDVIAIVDALDAAAIRVGVDGSVNSLKDEYDIFTQNDMGSIFTARYVWAAPMPLSGDFDPCGPYGTPPATLPTSTACHYLSNKSYSDLTDAQKYAMDDDNLYFIGATPGSGDNANAPCHCCLLFQVRRNGEMLYFEAVYDVVGPCQRVKDPAYPCVGTDTVKGLLPGNLLQKYQGGPLPDEGTDISGWYDLSLDGSQNATINALRCVSDADKSNLTIEFDYSDGEERFVSATLGLNGYFVWKSKRTYYQLLASKFTEIFNAVPIKSELTEDCTDLTSVDDYIAYINERDSLCGEGGMFPDPACLTSLSLFTYPTSMVDDPICADAGDYKIYCGELENLIYLIEQLDINSDCCPAVSTTCESKVASAGKFSPCGEINPADGLHYMTVVTTYEGGWTRTTTYTQDDVTGVCTSSYVCEGSGVYTKHNWISGDLGHADAYTEYTWSIIDCVIHEEITDWYGSCQALVDGVPGASCPDTDGSDKPFGSECRSCHDYVLFGASYPNTSYSGDKPSYVEVSKAYSDPWVPETTAHMVSRANTKLAETAWPGTWYNLNCYGYRNLSGDESGIYLRAARLKFYLPAGELPSGKKMLIRYHLLFEPEGGGPTTSTPGTTEITGTESAIIYIDAPTADGTTTLVLDSAECVEPSSGLHFDTPVSSMFTPIAF